MQTALRPFFVVPPLYRPATLNAHIYTQNIHTYINAHICTCLLSLLRKLSFNISVYTLSRVKFMDPFAGRYLFHLSAATSVLLFLLLHLLNHPHHLHRTRFARLISLWGNVRLRERESACTREFHCTGYEKGPLCYQK